MKRRSFCLLTSVLAILVCCSKDPEKNDAGQVTGFLARTRTEAKMDSTFLVTQSDLECYLLKIERFGHKKDWKSIRPVDYDGVLTSYLVEFDSGWEVISADKRGPIVLAISEDGPYDESALPEAARLWMASLNEEIADRWEQGLPMDEGNENEMASLDFWSMVTRMSPGENPPARQNPDDPPIGHFEYYETIVIPEVYDSIPHLTTTIWDQDSPYNYACPNLPSPLTGKALAGCGPVACAQMLFFFHNLWGIPDKAPSYASCMGDISSYSFDIPEPNSITIWSEMNNNSSPISNKAYILLADVGYRANAEYDTTFTISTLGSLRDVFFDYGISNDCDSYQKDTVIRSLSNGIPVFSYAKMYDSVGVEQGHFFLIDAYVRYVNRIEDYYIWVVDGNSGSPIPSPVMDMFYHYSSPYIQLIKMNWGWGGLYNNLSFAPSGTWAVSDNCVFDHGFVMLHNYGVID